MNRFEIRHVLPGDALHIAAHSNDAKKSAEIRGFPNWWTLAHGLEIVSLHSRTITLNDEPIAAFGVVAMPSGEGSVWLVAVDNLPPFPASLIKEQLPHIEWMRRRFTALTASVWENNKHHVRWVKGIGFKEVRKTPQGINGEVFHEFILEGA